MSTVKINYRSQMKILLPLAKILNYYYLKQIAHLIINKPEVYITKHSNHLI